VLKLLLMTFIALKAKFTQTLSADSSNIAAIIARFLCNYYKCP